MRVTARVSLPRSLSPSMNHEQPRIMHCVCMYKASLARQTPKFSAAKLNSNFFATRETKIPRFSWRRVGKRLVRMRWACCAKPFPGPHWKNHGTAVQQDCRIRMHTVTVATATLANAATKNRRRKLEKNQEKAGYDRDRRE